MKKIVILILVFTSIVFSQKFTQIQSNQITTKIHPFFQEEIKNIRNGAVSGTIGIESVANNENGEKLYQAMIRISDEVEILNSGVNINLLFLDSLQQELH